MKKSLSALANYKTFFMKKYLSIIPVVLLATLAPAQTEIFDIASFVAPQGWERKDSLGIILFHDYKTENGMTQFCQLFLYPSRLSKNSPEKNFQEEWNNRVVKNTGVSQKPNTTTEKNPRGWTAVTGVANITMQEITYTCILVSASGFGKVISVLINVAGEDYMPAIEKFFNDLNLDADQAPATSPGQNNLFTNPLNQIPGSNNGTFYYGIQAGSQGFEYGNSNRYLYLSPDYTFRYGYSKEGYYNYNTQSDRARIPDFAGTYTKSGSNINLNFYSGRTMQFLVNSNNKDLDGSLYKLIKFPQVNGLTVEGTYIKADLIRDLWPNGVQPKATLHKNGRFEDQGLMGIGETVDISLPFQEWKERTANLGKWGTGRYTIVDNSLIINYDDGRIKQMLINIYEEEVKKISPGLIVVGGSPFTLVK